MGDLPSSSDPHALEVIEAGVANNGYQIHPHQSSPSLRSPGSNTPFYSQLSSIPQARFQTDVGPPSSSMGPQYPPQDHGATSLNMAAMAGALPEYAASDGGQAAHSQRPLSGASTSAVVYQLQQNVQVHGPASSNTVPLQAGYGPSFVASQFQQTYLPAQASAHANYAAFPMNQQRGVGPNSIHSPYQNYSQQSPYVYYPAPYGTQPFVSGLAGQSASSHSMYDRRSAVTSSQVPSSGQGLEMAQRDGMFSPGHRTGPGTTQGDTSSIGWMPSAHYMQPAGITRSGPVSSIPRGPPRKPKQSGHALWVGNLPPGTTVIALKDHFSRDATKDIESLFLISKSNCAFVNYRTETSCTAAMHRFHDSRFNGVRLVCRLRRSSAPASGVPTGPSAMVGAPTTNATPPMSPQNGDNEPAPKEGESKTGARDDGDENSKASPAIPDKYFIVKSLTLQDLELSVRNGIWATQSHNEEVLNKAFETADNVFLIFSANKSGEYFGYARMTSRILQDDGQLMGLASKPDNIIDGTDVPKSIPTPATEFAPKGRIIDDSARGTIFWEAELTDTEGEEEHSEKDEPQENGEFPVVAQSWGKPFRIEWISTNRLPFYRTRGLRNPWNANREVKIARDGTELEPSVGERLLQMFRGPGPAPLMQSHTGVHVRNF